MDIDVKIDDGIVSIALLLITGRSSATSLQINPASISVGISGSGRTRATSLQINPASISIGISGFFLRLLEGINFKPGNIAGFNSSNTAALSLLTGQAIIKTNPVSADFTGDIISGNGSIYNIPACIQTPISSYVSLMSSVLPAKTVRVGTVIVARAAHNKFIYSNNTVIIN